MNLKIKKISIIIIITAIVACLGYFGFKKITIKQYQDRLTKAPIGTFVKAGNMQKARAGDSSILLPDGKVLIVGGSSYGTGAEIFDPKTGKFKLIFPKLKFAQSKIIQLDNDTVLVGGQYILDLKRLKYKKLFNENFGGYIPCERINENEIFIFALQTYIYNISSGELKKYEGIIPDIFSKNLLKSTFAFTFVQLDNDKILVVIPEVFSGKPYLKLVFYIWDYKKDELKYINEKSFFSLYPTIIKLDNSRIYIIGGSKDRNPLIYNIEQNKFTETSKTNGNRYYFPKAIKLKNGNIMIVGGEYNSNPQENSWFNDMTVEFYNPDENKYYVGPTLSRRFGPWVTAHVTFYLQELNNGNVLISGGMTHGGHPWRTSLVYKGE